MENAGLGQAGTRGASTCSLRSLMVFCISRTKSLKSFVPSPCGCSEEEGGGVPGTLAVFPDTVGGTREEAARPQRVSHHMHTCSQQASSTCVIQGPGGVSPPAA